MRLYDIEIEFFKVLFLGFFFGWTFSNLIGGHYKSKRTLREIKWYGKFWHLNKRKEIKLDMKDLA